MEPSFLIQDPQHEYAVALIKRIRARFGYRPICFYSDVKAEFYARRHFPELLGQLVERSYQVSAGELGEFARFLERTHDVVGIVPWAEETVANAAVLAEKLGLDWPPPAVLARFRDKHALKTHLRRACPSLGILPTRLVHSASEVFAEPLPDRFVIKPNAGFGNRQIGFFDRETARPALERYFTGAELPCILEPFIAGHEYAVNGQVDGRGEATVLTIQRYDRAKKNGIDNVYYLTHALQRHEPEFSALAAYATSVMRASGLIRCPFHMEVIANQEGVFLIEIGARLGGQLTAEVASDLHGPGFDVYDVAAHYYLSGEDYGALPLDWTRHDRLHHVHLDGVAERSEVIYALAGIAEVEALPEFRRWVIKPRVGGLVQRTVDIFTMPYSVHLMGETRARVDRAAAKVRELVRWNQRVSTLERARVEGERLTQRLADKARWLAHSVQLPRGS